MRYVELGGSGVELPVVTMGCWGIAGDGCWEEQDRREAIEAIRCSLDLGVTGFDTAEGYNRGASEEILGEALAGVRDRAAVATKVSRRNLAPADLRAACERSLARLRTDRIDLYQVHWPNPDVPLADTLGALEELRAEGKVRATGVSNFGTGDLADLAATAHGPLVGNQLPYSLLWRAIEEGIVDACRDLGLGILAYSPLAQGLLTGKWATPDEVPVPRRVTRWFAARHCGARHGGAGCEAEVFAFLDRMRELCAEAGIPMAHAAIAWTLDRPGVSAVIVGARDRAQAEVNAAAADAVLPADLAADLAAASEPVKRALGPDPDMWFAPAESRYR